MNNKKNKRSQKSSIKQNNWVIEGNLLSKAPSRHIKLKHITHNTGTGDIVFFPIIIPI